ncbi:MAG: hypothetical protein QXQ81_05305 [Candidatus Thorarchaeota archaeon]
MMSGHDGTEKTGAIFAILKGESIGHAGEFNGAVVVVKSVDDLNRKWSSGEIAVVSKDLEQYFSDNPREIERLLESAGAVMTEFGSSIGEWATFAHASEKICIAKVRDCTYVVENGMHLRLVAYENLGEIFFID